MNHSLIHTMIHTMIHTIIHIMIHIMIHTMIHTMILTMIPRSPGAGMVLRGTNSNMEADLDKRHQDK